MWPVFSQARRLPSAISPIVPNLPNPYNLDKKGVACMQTNRRKFMQLMGATTFAAMQSNIAKALAIPANNRTGTIQDVEHVVILMQENRPFDHHFGTLRGVRGYNDPRAVKINLPN